MSNGSITHAQGFGQPESYRGVDRVLLGQYVALGVSVAASVWLVAFAPKHSGLTALVVVCATAAAGAFSVLQRRASRRGGRRLGGAVVAVGIGMVMLVAVGAPNRTSNDLWSYGSYGRMVVVHHANPYVATPSEFPHDPFSRRVSQIWQHRSSVYGPVWVGVTAVDALVVGTSPLGNRLFFQLLAAIAATTILTIVWKRTRSPAALVWLGLHPVFVFAINSGHADLLIGLAILVGSLSIARGQAGWVAGVLIGLAALIKVTALLGLLGIVLWAWRARRRRLVRQTLVGAGAVVVLGYAPFFADASHVLGNADHTVSLWSPWNGLADLILGHDALRQLPNPLAFNQTLETLFYAGTGLVVVLAVVIGWRASAAREPRPVAGVTAAAYPIGAAYSLPWYANWALPCLTDPDPSPLAWIVWLQAATMLTALKLHDHPAGTIADAISRGLITDVLPVVWVIAFIVFGLRQTQISDIVDRHLGGDEQLVADTR